MQYPKIVVCGGTGNQGGAVARALLKSGIWSVTALTRDPGSDAAMALVSLGAEVVKADLLDMGSLRDAFAGAYGVFGMTQPWSYENGRFDHEAELRQGKNIIWACRENGVMQVVYSSILNMKDDVSHVPYVDSKLLLEDLFTRNLPGSIIVRPALYMENIGTALLKIRGNKIKGRFGSDKYIPYIALSDIGASVAEIFGSPDNYTGNKIILAGDIVSGNELAALLSAISPGMALSYEPANELTLRLFRPRFFHMRRFFEQQGSLLHKEVQPDTAFYRLPADPVTMADFLRSSFGTR